MIVGVLVCGATSMAAWSLDGQQRLVVSASLPSILR